MFEPNLKWIVSIKSIEIISGNWHYPFKKQEYNVWSKSAFKYAI